MMDLPEEFDDIKYVMLMGADKYGQDNWLQPNGIKSSLDQMHQSMSNHLSASISGERSDAESGMDPLLHLATRALMLYTRIKRGLV